MNTSSYGSATNIRKVNLILTTMLTNICWGMRNKIQRIRDCGVSISKCDGYIIYPIPKYQKSSRRRRQKDWRAICNDCLQHNYFQTWQKHCTHEVTIVETTWTWSIYDQASQKFTDRCWGPHEVSILPKELMSMAAGVDTCQFSSGAVNVPVECSMDIQTVLSRH